MAKEIRRDGQVPRQDREADHIYWDETTQDVMLVAGGSKDPEPEPEEETEFPVLPPDFPQEADYEDRKFGIGEYWVHYFQEASPFGEEPEEIKTPKEQPRPTQAAAPETAAAQPLVAEPKQPSQKWRTLFQKLRKQKETRMVGKETQPVSKAKRARRRAGIAAAVVLGLLAAGMLVIAEPWVPPAQDEYAQPQAQVLGEKIEMAVGQSNPLSIPLGENEQIVSVVSSDMDVLDCSGDFVIAIGEWDDVTVTVTTQEKEVPQPELKPFKIFGIDLTGAYNSLRSGLRDLLGIEEKTEPRTEPRTLGIYQIQYRIQGYTTKEMPAAINLYTNDRYSMILDVPEGMEVQFECEGSVVSVEQGSLEDDELVGYIAYSGWATGQGELVVRFGFMKEGSFVTTGAIVYKVQVLQPPVVGEEAAFASGNYNGTIPIEPPEETD